MESLQVIVEANDGGNITDTMTITIIVDDANDMTPVFTNLQNYTVKEVS